MDEQFSITIGGSPVFFHWGAGALFDAGVNIKRLSLSVSAGFLDGDYPIENLDYPNGPQETEFIRRFILGVGIGYLL